MVLEILRKIGLSEGEIKVYSALLDLGVASVNEIHEKAGMERRNIYDILNKLIEKGLISYTEENKKKTFQITHPNKLIGYLDEKKKEIDNSKSAIAREIPLITEKFNAKKPEIKAEVYRGEEGTKAVWDDMLNYKEVYWIGSGRYIPKRFPNFFIPWNKRRVKLKVKIYNLVRYELRKEIKVWQLEYVKFLPKEFSGTPTVVAIYGDKVASLIYGENLFSFVIESKELADNYKRYHKYLWDNVAKA
jgi:sugar-specific transcriptional regulator TrmB